MIVEQSDKRWLNPSGGASDKDFNSADYLEHTDKKWLIQVTKKQHADAARLLEEVVRVVPAPVLRAFGAVIQAKFEYEYAGEVFTQAAAKRLLVKAERFYKWAGEQLG